MTLRESAKNYVDTFINEWNSGRLYRMLFYSSNRWGVLFSLVAREYILEKLNSTLTEFEFRFNYCEEDNVFYLFKEKKSTIKIPISSLSLDEEFTWDKITLY